MEKTTNKTSNKNTKNAKNNDFVPFEKVLEKSWRQYLC